MVGRAAAFGARRRRNDRDAERIRAELIKRQHQDGGWGWLSVDESDAFGTGVACMRLRGMDWRPTIR